MKKLKGIPASDGLAVGPVLFYQPETPLIARRTDADPTIELRRFEAAITTVDEYLIALKANIESAAGREEAEIFDVHRMFLSDPAFVGTIRQLINTEHLNAEAAVDQVASALAAQFETLEDEYLRQRSVDVADIGGQLLRRLTGWGQATLANLFAPSIIIARVLSPSDTAALDRQMVLAFCTAAGGPTSHTAILARSLAIPAVVGLGDELFRIVPQEQLLLGMGLEELSMTPSAIPTAKALIRTLSRASGRPVADHCLTLAEIEQVYDFLSQAF